MARSQEMFAVTKIEGGKHTLIDEGLTFYEAFSMVVDLREFMNTLMTSDIAPRHRTYYRMGRPH